ncbi:MAG: hypothetical protein O3A01_07225 [bacterium]|nr:hypothetical protein [bacterium]
MLYRRIAHQNTYQAFPSTGAKSRCYIKPPTHNDSLALLKGILNKNPGLLFDQTAPFNLFIVMFLLFPFAIFSLLAIQAQQKG